MYRMKVSQFLLDTASLYGDSLIYMAAGSKDHINELIKDQNIEIDDLLKSIELHKVAIGVDNRMMFCDIIWNCRAPDCSYHTGTLYEVRAHSFDTSKDADMVTSTSDNVLGFNEVRGYKILKHAYYSKDVVILYV